MRRVVLINPPQTELHDPLGYPPQGLLSIAGYLVARDIPTEVVNLADCPMEELESKGMAAVPDADWYGVGFTTPLYGSAKELVRLLKKRRNGKVVIGGVHPPVLSWETFQDIRPDHLVIGDGEVPMFLLAEGAYGDSAPKMITGKSLAMDRLPLPTRHLLEDGWQHRGTMHGAKPGQLSTSVVTSRGCPYKCAYCSKYELGCDVRYRTARQVYTEVRHLRNVYGIEHVRFVDDVFSLDRNRTDQICHLLEPLGVTWLAITRADLVNADILRRMAGAGCTELCFGVESGSQEQLKRMNKRANIDATVETIGLARKAGIKTKVFLLYGFPGECRETVEATKEFMRRAQPEAYTLSTFIPLPGSAVFTNPEKYGVTIRSRDFARYWFYWDQQLSKDGTGLVDGGGEGYFIEYPNMAEIIEMRTELQDFLASGEWR